MGRPGARALRLGGGFRGHRICRLRPRARWLALPGNRARTPDRRQRGDSPLVATDRRGARLAHGLATESRQLFAAQPLLAAFVLAAVCLSMLGAIVSVAPEIRTDALIYQLAVPQAYVRHHGLVNLPGNFRSYWVGLANMPSTLGLLLTGLPLPQLWCSSRVGCLPGRGWSSLAGWATRGPGWWQPASSRPRPICSAWSRRR